MQYSKHQAPIHTLIRAVGRTGLSTSQLISIYLDPVSALFPGVLTLVQRDTGDTPLHYAYEYRCLALVHYLMQSILDDDVYDVKIKEIKSRNSKSLRRGIGAQNVKVKYCKIRI